MGDSDTIPILERTIRLLEAVAQGRATGSIARMSRELDIPTTSCYRIIRTLQDADWLRMREAGQGYEMSFGLLPLVWAFDHHRALMGHIEPFLAQLAKAAELSGKVTVRRGEQAVTVLRADSDRPIAITGRLGVRFHLAQGSSGAALLSGLEADALLRIIDSAPPEAWQHQQPGQLRRRITHCRRYRWCIDRGGYQPGIHTMSGPIRDRDGQVRAAITLLGMPGDFDGAARRRIAGQLINALDQCEQAIASQRSDA